ncbi:hypothetical protein D3C71_217690 [compost metagenome]
MPSFQYGPCGDGAMRHFGVPSLLTTGKPGFVMPAVNAVYQKICWAISPCAGTGPDSEKFMPFACGGAYFFIQSMYFVSAKTAAGELVAPPRDIEAPTGVHLSAATLMPHSSTGMPFGMPLSAAPAIDSHASVKRQPSDGSFLP